LSPPKGPKDSVPSGVLYHFHVLGSPDYQSVSKLDW
jgi:hypothetical protein